MKKFTKLFLSCAAVAAVTAAVATSAMAANLTGDLEGAYDPSTGVLNITTALTGESTVLVLAPDAITETDTTIADSEILYIDQAEIAATTNMGLKGKPTADGVYTVWVANAADNFATIKKATFRIGESETSTIIGGDTSGDGNVNLTDQGQMLRYLAERSDNIGNVGTAYEDPTDPAKKIVVGDTSGDANVNLTDQGQMLRYLAERSDNIGNAGQEIEVGPEIAPAE